MMFNKKTTNSFSVFGLIIIALASCKSDPSMFSLEMYVSNQTNCQVRMDIDQYFEYETGNFVDTSFYLASSQSELLFSSNPSGNAEDIYSEKIPLFDSLTVVNCDSVYSFKNFTSRDEWDYQRVSDSEVTYTLVLDDSDFNP